MPHQCVRCGKIYPDNAPELLTGCSCGSKLFFYIKKDKLEELKKATSKLTEEEKKQIEKDVMDLVGPDQDQPVILDFESIRIRKPGKYELDLVKLFEGKPLIYKIGDGKYIIDIEKTFEELNDKKKNHSKSNLL